MILLHGTGTHNKGAELMAVAVLQHYRRLPHPPEFAVPPQFGSYRDRAKYGLWTLMQERRWGRAKLVSLLAHPAFRRKYGLAVESDCTTVIDASGFAFGDQHGPRPTQTMAAQCKRWKSQGKKIVLLPQAFGPFSSPEIRQACRQLVEHCDLVFAREETSLGHLMDVVGPRENIRQAPDFTNLVEGRLPDGFEPWEDAALVVPNTRMLDKTDPQTAEKYLPFVASVIAWLRNAGLRPALLLHTPEDEQLVPPLLDLAGNAIPVLRESCPVALKGFWERPELSLAPAFTPWWVPSRRGCRLWPVAGATNTMNYYASMIARNAYSVWTTGRAWQKSSARWWTRPPTRSLWPESAPRLPASATRLNRCGKPWTVCWHFLFCRE